MPAPKSPHTLSVVLLRGGGDLASGVALRLHHAGITLIITELAQPLAVRRLVAFSEAVYCKKIEVEGVVGRLVSNPEEAVKVIQGGDIPVLVDPDCDVRFAPQLRVLALIDARMTKRPPELGVETAPLVIGLGPGFVAGENCHAVIETNRGPQLGRVIWDGNPEPDTRVPGMVGDKGYERVLRAPVDGQFQPLVDFGAVVEAGAVIATVSGEPVLAPFGGLLRGILPQGILVKQGMKVGDLDPRKEGEIARMVSDKSLAIGGGVLEALLSRPEIRTRLWC